MNFSFVQRERKEKQFLNVSVRTGVFMQEFYQVIKACDVVYVMELKMYGTAQEAIEQINSKDYATPYQSEDKPLLDH